MRKKLLSLQIICIVAGLLLSTGSTAALTVPDIAPASVDAAVAAAPLQEDIDGGDEGVEPGCINWPVGADHCASSGRHHTQLGPDPNGIVEGGHSSCMRCVSITVISWFPYVADTTATNKEDCHEACTAFAALHDALDAAYAGRLPRVLALAPRLKGRIGYNSERGEVQLLDCTGRAVIVSMPVPISMRNHVGSALPDVHLSMRYLALGPAGDRSHEGKPGGSAAALIALCALPAAGLSVFRRRR